MTEECTLNNFLCEVPLSQISEVLKLGEIIGVKLSNESEWISDVVEKIIPHENIAEIRLLEQFIGHNLMLDDIISIRNIREDFEYVLTAKVIDLGIHNLQKLSIEILKISKFTNERKSDRYTVNLCAKVTYCNNEKSTFAVIKNISSTGVALMCKEFIGINEDVDVDIVLWKEQVISIEGKIARMFKINNNYKYGILIDTIDKKSKQVLDEFVEELQEKEKELLK